MSVELREALGKIIESGYQLSADAFDYLKTVDRDLLQDTVRRVLLFANSSEKDVVILDRIFFQKVIERSREKSEVKEFITGKPRGRPLASEYEGQIQVLNNQPPEPSGDLKGFIDYFRSRFKKIEGIFRKRIDMKDVVTIGIAQKMPLKSKMKVIGMVTTKRASGPRLFIELEDPEDSITVMTSDSETVRKGLTILQDQVICVDAVKFKHDLLIANDFIWPDIPSHSPRRSEIPMCVAFLADLHIGSKLFQKKIFNRFIRWMNLEVGRPESRKMAARVKYVIITGDLVDGIGVYPNHMDELEIKDIREQYETAALILSELPNYVEIIIIPGNHDPVRKSLPQPPISKQYAERLHNDDRIHFLGNPSHLLINGVEVYISHGKALEEVLSRIPGMNFHNPEVGIELLLRCRHVAPTYGTSIPIAPEKVDRLVIESTPDIIQMGHIHVYGYRRYKGTTIIASGSWQEQTSFQKRVNLSPTIGIAPIVDLQTHNIAPLDFTKSY